MVIVVLGGGGVRTPILIRGLLRRLKTYRVEEVRLLDVDARRLTLIGRVVSEQLRRAGNPFRLVFTEDAREGLRGADVVISAIRVGGDAARIVDEVVPLRYDVLGQETTGPGGFAMAMRTIPVLLEYARLLEEVAPHCWFINFTNPSGLITQALTAHSKVRVVGICDGPGALARALTAALNISATEVYVDYFGLNHLGWVKGLYWQGRDLLPEVLEHFDLAIRDPVLKRFGGAVVQALGVVPQEYLYYYYFAREAVANIKATGHTRGEFVRNLNDRLWERLDAAGSDGARAVSVYEEYITARHGSYMQVEAGLPGHEERFHLDSAEESGYEAVALSVLDGLFGDRPTRVIVNVPNRGAIGELDDEDVVEVPCAVSSEGIRPYAVGPVPESVRGLMITVKTYERATIAAAILKSYALALRALIVHPLVPSVAIAQRILDDYRREHGQWLQLS
ncbi:MAG: 6-phospho-beta-glucosidase [Armatimonadota bacterium]|nr:6-phospho-beta-glucosidase [Armatimonadota bacterium]